jgi:predicted dehydrogenase
LEDAVKELRLGVIGLSEGNGHPYSWSAIFNGYDPAAMRECPFPVIPEYLSRHRFPHDAISGARVTHVWTQCGAISRHVAKAACIAHVASDPRDLIPHIDGLLLARDDAQNHYRYAAPFLEAGIPVYIDKPFALTERAARQLLALERWRGQIFTCSAMRYAHEFQLSDEQRAQLGQLRFVQGIVPKDWNRYAVHAIDPAICLMDSVPELRRIQTWHEGGVTTTNVQWGNGIQGSFTAVGKLSGSAPIALRLVGTRTSIERTFHDAFAAFKGALSAFVTSVRTRQAVHDIEIDLAIVRVIESAHQEPPL